MKKIDIKYGSKAVTRRKAPIAFISIKAQWSGGVKPTEQTMDRINAIDWSKPYG